LEIPKNLFWLCLQSEVHWAGVRGRAPRSYFFSA
jgi:hypothetical protein